MPCHSHYYCAALTSGSFSLHVFTAPSEEAENSSPPPGESESPFTLIYFSNEYALKQSATHSRCYNATATNQSYL